MERRLWHEGFDTRAVRSGEEACENLAGVDLVLLDFRLPEMTGLQALAAIQAAGGPSVVMVTGMGSEDLAVEAMRAGAIDYVVKSPSYLDALPEVVARAWRHHDLARRASELQRVALLVHAATDRETIFSEIVGGARELLAARSCVLCVEGDDGLEVAAHTGPPIDGPDKLLMKAEEALEAGAHITQPSGDELFVRLARSDEDPVGVLVVATDQPHEFPLEEITLAETFASFAVLALRNFNRLQLERELVTELRRTDEERRSFIDSVSHELRTPLACIAGFSSTLLDHWDRLDEGTARRYLEKVWKHTQDLAELMHQTLDFGEIERGRFAAHVQPVELEHEVESALESLGPLFEGRSVEVGVPRLEVLADRELLQRVLSNLLTNALKYSPGGTSIAVRGRRGDGTGLLEISDEGVGLTSEQVGRVFEPFWRAPETVRSGSRGVGIGLSLCKHYLEAMGGAIWVSSQQGSGSTFTFTLPLADDHADDAT